MSDCYIFNAVNAYKCAADTSSCIH